MRKEMTSVQCGLWLQLIQLTRTEKPSYRQEINGFVHFSYFISSRGYVLITCNSEMMIRMYEEKKISSVL